MIPADLNLKEIKSLFIRLNMTNTSLNPQEIRNAKFDGLFIKNAIRIADSFFGKSTRFFLQQILEE